MEQISRRSVLTAIGGVVGAGALAGCADDAEPGLADTTSTTYHRGTQAAEGASGGESETSRPSGRLTEVDLAPPDDLRDRWAAYAAMWRAAGISGGDGGPRAEGGDWIYEMETGQWAVLVRLKDGRAVLAGQADPDIRRGGREKAARADLVAGAPSWWTTYREAVPDFNSLGFVLGWDGKRWQRSADAGGSGGFGQLTFYVASDEQLGEQLVRWGSSGEQGYSGSAKAAADRVMRAGPKVTAAQLKALGPGLSRENLAAAVKAAQAFEGKGKH